VTDEGSFRRLASVAAIVGAILASGSGAVLLMALGGPHRDPFQSFQAFSHPTNLLLIGHSGAMLLRWGMMLDLFGYYLPLAPVIVALWSLLQPRGRSVISLYAVCGLGYVLVGALGAAILAAVVPPLIDTYGASATSQRETLALVVTSIVNAVYVGLWNILEATLAGVWWVGIGVALRRARRTPGVLSIVLGACWLLDAVGHVVGVQAIWFVPLGAIFLLYPIWAVWLGIALLRPPAEADGSDPGPRSPRPM
jgi:hypothetical protein